MGGGIVPPILNLGAMLLCSEGTNCWYPLSRTAGCEPTGHCGEEKNLLLWLGVKT
jgi:hypothetical protein